MSGGAMPRPVRTLLTIAIGVVLLACGWIAFCAHLMAGYPLRGTGTVKTSSVLARAPFADQIIIGDSRVDWARPSGDPLFAGYSSATAEDLAALTATICSVSGADIVIALGVNDTKANENGPDVALAALANMAEACSDNALSLAQIWPVEPAVEPSGWAFDTAQIAQINAGIADLAQRTGAQFIPAPAITGHTIDGVHFDAATAQAYIAALAGSEAVFTIDPVILP